MIELWNTLMAITSSGHSPQHNGLLIAFTGAAMTWLLPFHFRHGFHGLSTTRRPSSLSSRVANDNRHATDYIKPHLVFIKLDYIISTAIESTIPADAILIRFDDLAIYWGTARS